MFNDIIGALNNFLFNTNNTNTANANANNHTNNTHTPSADFSHLPPEILTDIFKMLSFPQGCVRFALVCRQFSQIAAANMSPVHGLVHEIYKSIEFTQKNRIFTFLTLGSPKNKPEIVITGDNAEYQGDPQVTLWEHGKSPLCTTSSFPFHTFFYKPIQWLTIGGQSNDYLAAAQYNRDGLIQIYKIKEGKVLEKEIGKEISCLNADKDQLLIGFEDGTLQILNFSDLSLLQEWQACYGSISKIFVDSSMQRIFTFSYEGLKIRDIESRECLKEFNHMDGVYSIYDSKSQYLICQNKEQNKRSVTILSHDGTEIATFTDSDESASLRGIHFNAESGLLFASFETKISWNNQDLGRAKMVVWDVKTKQLVTSFLTITTPQPEPGICDIASHIDFDPHSRLILTGGYCISLWDLDTGTLIKKLPLIGRIKEMIWEKESQRLFVLIDGKLHLFDYSRSPFKIGE